MTIELHFNRFAEWPAARRARPPAERAAREALRRAGPPGGSGGGATAGGGGGPGHRDRGGGPAAPEGGEVSFTCLAADEIAEMNRRYLDREGPTDVIAFPLSDPGAPPVGDVYLCPDVARESAGERGLPPAEEIVRLVAHGALHVTGHTHPEGEGRESSEMFRLQEEIVRRALGAGGGSGDAAGGAGEGGPPRDPSRGGEAT